MTIKQLKQSVLGLVFDEDLVSGELFYNSVNRAIERVRMSFPKTDFAEMAINNMKNQLGEEFLEYDIAGEEIELFGEDLKGIFFRAEGVGSMIVYWFNDDLGVKEYESILRVDIDSVGKFQDIKKLIRRNNKYVNGKFKVVFRSDFCFKVSCVAFYDRLRSNSEEHIQAFLPFNKFDLNKLIVDQSFEYGEARYDGVFLRLNEPIKLLSCGQLKNIAFKINQSVLEIPREIEGVIHIDYVKKFDTVGVHSNENQTVDTPSAFSEVLSYLVASNLLCEDEEEKSKYFLALYQNHESLNNINSSPKYSVSLNTLGWTK